MRRWLRAIRKSVEFDMDFLGSLGIIFLVGGALNGLIGLITNNISLFLISVLVWLVGFTIAFVIIGIEVFVWFKELFRDFIDRVKSNLEE